MLTKRFSQALSFFCLPIFLCYIIISSIGCTVSGFEIETTSKRLESRPDKSQPTRNEVDIDLSVLPAGDEIVVDLRKTPYYLVETRNFIEGKYKGATSPTSLLIGLAEIGLLALLLNITKDTPDTDYEGKEFDSYLTEPSNSETKNDLSSRPAWQRAIVLGAVADLSLAYYLDENVWNKKPAGSYTEWKSSDQEEVGAWEPLENHPFQLEIPALELQVDLHSEDGTAVIHMQELAEKLPRQKSRFQPFYQQLKNDQIEFRITTQLEGQEYSKLFPIQDKKMAQHFRNLSRGVDMVSALSPQLMPKPVASLSWDTGEIKAGSQARLHLDIENQGKGDLYRFVAETDSRLSMFDQKRLEFGRIPPNQSRTLTFTFETNSEAISQEVPILVRFEEHNDYVPDAINTKLYLRAEDRPKFDFSYRVVDGGTESSVGNGDGIIQYGESFDLVLTVRNSGQGTASQVAATLNLIIRQSARSSGNRGVALFGDTQVNLGNISPGDSTTTQFNIGIKPNARLASIPIYLSLEDQKFKDVQLTEKFTIPVDKRVSPKIVVIDLQATVISPMAPIHSGADAQTSLVAQVPQHSRLSVSGQLGDWYRITSSSIEGWVRRDAVTTEEIIEVNHRRSQPQTTQIIKVFQQMPPSLTLVTPEVATPISVAIGNLEVLAVAADDEGIKEVRLTVNGKLVNSRGMKIKRKLQKTVTVKESIPLQYGQNRVELVATDIQGQQSELISFMVERKRDMNELWVLSIGISDYQHGDITKLKYADDDARAIADYFSQIGIPEDHITLLTDEEATVSRVRQALGQLMNQAGKNSTVVIYFSGHGAPSANQQSQDGDGIDKYLLTCEANPNNFYGTALPMDEVAGIFQRLRSERVIFIADTCYSGAAGGKTAFASNLVGKKAAPNYDRFLSRVAEGSGRVILTASQGTELSQEDSELGHGVFTYFVLTGLQGAADLNGDGFVTVQEVYRFASQKVPERSDQNPSCKGEESGSIVLDRVR